MRELAQAEPLPDGTRLLHIGLPKAGSTALQGALHAARPQLAEHDVLLAGRTRHPYSAATVAVGRSRPWYTARQARAWEQIATQLRESTSRLAVLSSETLSRADGEHARQICEAVSSTVDQVHVTIVARPLALVLPSLWQETLRGREVPAFGDWLKQATADPAESAVAAWFLRRFDIPRMLTTWGRVVGEGRVTIIVLDPRNRSPLLESFDRLLGLPLGTLQPQAHLANESLPYPEAEMLRMVHQRFQDEGGTAEEWITDVSRRLRPRLRDLRSPGPTDRIRSPRWAVEAINDLTSPWLDEIRSSGATVVGDLSNLIADPEPYDELAEPPTAITISSAAQIAQHFYRIGREHRGTPANAQQAASAPTIGKPTIAQPTVAETPARELAREVGRRAVRRLLRR